MYAKIKKTMMKNQFMVKKNLFMVKKKIFNQNVEIAKKNLFMKKNQKMTNIEKIFQNMFNILFCCSSFNFLKS